MPPPFPGMDPWLEHPGLWPDLHERLVIAIADDLGPRLRPHYYVAVGIHSYVITLPPGSSPVRYPDVTVVDTPGEGQASTPAASDLTEPAAVTVPIPEPVKESYLEVREVATGKVITTVEVLSPTNKRPGEGREAYEAKRLAILSSQTSLVEIDLLRDWEPMPFWGDVQDSHYRILVRRGERREHADLYAFNVRDPIPRFPLPLQPGDAEPAVDLKPLLDGVYDRASYDLRVDYTRPPIPSLSDADAEWARQALSQANTVTD